MKIWADNEKLSYTGRIDWTNTKAPVFVFPCTSVQMNFTGNQLSVCVENHNAYWNNYLGYILDGEQQSLLLPKSGEVELRIPVKENQNNTHSILLFKRQDSCHEVVFKGFEIEEGETILAPDAKSIRKIEVYGDSVSAGEVSEAVEYVGKADPEHNGEFSNSWYSYAWMTARKLNAEIHDIAQGGIALMDHTGWFFEPNAVGMESAWDKVHYNPTFGNTTKWNFKQYTPDVVIVAIGQNDNHPDDYMKEEYNGDRAMKWRSHYEIFLKNLRKTYPEAQIVCITTLLEHDEAWDCAIEQAVKAVNDEKISHYVFKRNGKATPGHLRISEAEEMAEELAAYIAGFSIEGWNE